MRLIMARLLLAVMLPFLLPVTGSFAADISDSNAETAQPRMATTLELPPKMVNPLKVKTITVKLKSAVVFTVKDPEIWKGKVVNAKIAKFVTGGPISAYETYPSLTLLKKGKTTISLTDGKKTYFLKLTVS